MTTAELQRASALARAKEVRSGRARILQPLRMGLIRIGDIDLTDPDLASMRVIDLLGNLRYRGGEARNQFKPKANRKATRLALALSFSGARTLGRLTERQRLELVGTVQERVELQRPA